MSTNKTTDNAVKKVTDTITKDLPNLVKENKGIFGFDIDLWQEADEGDKRYSYDVVNLPQSGTVFLNVTETVRPAFGDKVELYTKNSQELVRDAQNSAQTKSTIFTVFWTILVLLELGGLGYAVYQYQEY